MLHASPPPESAASSTLDELSVNTLRLLSANMVQRANSGHPGLPLGAAPMAYVLWTRFLQFDPQDPHRPNRDRFILSETGPGRTPVDRPFTGTGHSPKTNASPFIRSFIPLTIRQ